MKIPHVIPGAVVAELVDGIDCAFDGSDRWLRDLDAGTPVDVCETSEWFEPFQAEQGGSVLFTRPWARQGGVVFAADSPRLAHRWFNLIREIGLFDLVADYYGEAPITTLDKCALRRIGRNDGVGVEWHQDGSFLGEASVVNVWLCLSDTTESPGLDVVSRRFDSIVETGTGGAVRRLDRGSGGGRGAGADDARRAAGVRTGRRVDLRRACCSTAPLSRNRRCPRCGTRSRPGSSGPARSPTTSRSRSPSSQLGGGRRPGRTATSPPGCLRVLADHVSVDPVALDQPAQARRLVRAVEEDPPRRPAAEAVPGELRRRVPDRESDGARRDHEGFGLVDLELPTREEVVPADDREQHPDREHALVGALAPLREHATAITR